MKHLREVKIFVLQFFDRRNGLEDEAIPKDDGQ
jgi:hypothetical protein